MTSAPPETPAEETSLAVARHRRGGSLLARVRSLAGTRWWSLGGPLAVVLLAAVLRLQNLGHPASLMFDETFYVKDAWTMTNLGYEGSWPTDADASFNAGDVDVYTATASYMAHPPLGKWLISLGIQALGVTNPASWRLSVAIAGVLGVVVLMLIAHRLWRSTLLTVLAGGLFAIDGHAISLSRIGLLDNFVMLFGLLAFGTLLLDREWTARRLAARLRGSGSPGPNGEPPEPVSWGPVILFRPWLVVMGLSLGLMCAVKWSGLYFLAAFLLYVVAADALARRRLGVQLWPAAGVLGQGPVNVILVLPIAVAAYLASWTGWFVTSGGYDRNWLASGNSRWTGLLAWVPDSLQNLWHWHATIYAFHNSLSAPHPYASPAILWPFLARPTQIYFRGSSLGENGCQFSSCSEIVWSIANPIIWWAANLAALYLVYRFARFAEWRVGLALLGIAGGYLPWLLYPTRTMFQFYAIAYEPYLILCLVIVIGLLLGRRIGEPPRRDNLVRLREWRARRVRMSRWDGEDFGDAVVDPTSDPAFEPTAGPRPGRVGRLRASLRSMPVRRRFVGVFLVAAVLVSAFFYPLWTGMQTPFWFWTLHVWSNSWI